MFIGIGFGVVAAGKGATGRPASLSLTWAVDAAGNWSNPANWGSIYYPDAVTDTATLGTIITANRIVTLDVPVTLRNLNIGDDQNYTLAGAETLAFASGTPTLTVSSTGTPTISCPISLAAALALVSAPNSTLSGIISGAFGITKSGAGITTLSGANTFTGPLAINAGGIACGNVSALNSSNDVTTANTVGVSLDITGFSQTIRSLAGGGATGGGLVLGAATLTISGGTTTVFTGAVSGVGGSITLVGATALTLSGVNTLTGTITCSATGTIRTGSTTGFGTASIVLVSGSTFGKTTATLTNANINPLSCAGTVNIDCVGTGTWTYGTGAITLTGNTDFNVFVSGSTFSSTGVISGAFSLTKSGLGTLTLNTATNTYSGGTFVNEGILTISNVNSIPSGTTLNLGATTGSSSATANLITGFARPIVVRSGSSGTKTLARAAGNPSWTSTIALSDNLTIDAVNGNVSSSGVISGTGNITVNGTTGRLNMNSVNTNTGTITVSTGTYGGTGTGNGALTVASGATLQGGTGDTNAGTYTNTGNLTLSTGAIFRVGIGSTTTVSRATITGDITFNGNTVNFPASALNAGTYTIASYTGTQSGTLTMGSLPTGRTFSSFTYTAGLVRVVFT